MSNPMTVTVGPQPPARCVGFGQVVYMEADRLILGEPIGGFVNLRDTQRKAHHDPRLSLDNLGRHPHTGDKE